MVDLTEALAQLALAQQALTKVGEALKEDPPDPPDDPDPEPAKLKHMSGITAWINTGVTPTANYKNFETVAASPLAESISFFMRPDHLGLSPEKMDLAKLRDFRDMRRSNASDKPLQLAVIIGTADNGVGKDWLKGLDPKVDLIEINKGTENEKIYPAFWSSKFDERMRAMWVNIAKAFDPTEVDSVVVSLSYGENAEPWGMNRPPADAEYAKKAKAAGLNPEQLPQLLTSAILRHVDFLYKLFPNADLVINTGFAFGDNVPSAPALSSARHPWYFNLMRQARASYQVGGRRIIGKQNGANPGEGASGYGDWLAAVFGPKGKYPGYVAAQAIGGCVSDKVQPPRLSPPSKLAATIDKAVAQGASYLEIYFPDMLAAVTGATPDGKEIQKALTSVKGTFAK